MSFVLFCLFTFRTGCDGIGSFYTNYTRYPCDNNTEIDVKNGANWNECISQSTNPIFGNKYFKTYSCIENASQLIEGNSCSGKTKNPSLPPTLQPTTDESCVKIYIVNNLIMFVIGISMFV